jgi:hypothetical protein
MAIIYGDGGFNVVYTSLPVGSSAVVARAYAHGSNTPTAYGTFPSLFGLNWGDIGYKLGWTLVCMHYAQTIAAYFDYYLVHFGAYLGYDTHFMSEAGIMIEGGRVIFKNFYPVTSGLIEVLLRAKGGDPPDFILIATSPDGHDYLATSYQGVAELDINNAAQGDWTVQVVGVTVPPGDGNFTLNAAVIARLSPGPVASPMLRTHPC